MKNMSSRERTLTLAVLVMGTVVGGFVLFQWVNGQLRSKAATIANLESEMSDMKFTSAQLGATTERRQELEAKSLPSGSQVARTEYKAWLLSIANDHVGLVTPDVSVQEGAERKNATKGYPVYRTIRCTLTGWGTLPQCVQLLEEYYAADFVHRITSLTLSPTSQVDNSTGRQSERRDYLRITLVTEGLCLVDAADRPEDAPPRSPRIDLVQSVMNHRELLTRDFFNPAGELPKLSSDGSRFYLDEDIEIDLEAEDDDLFNRFEFVLDEESVPEELRGKVKIVPDESGSSARLVAPPLEEDRYAFSVTIIDNGSPPERTVSDVSFRVEERVARTENRDPEPDLIDFAELSYITACLQNKEGQLVVWIDVKPEDQIYEFTIGDDFEIGSVKGKVLAISGRTVIIEVGGEQHKYVVNDALSEPEILSGIRTVDGD